jgi:hypothetical protein
MILEAEHPYEHGKWEPRKTILDFMLSSPRLPRGMPLFLIFHWGVFVISFFLVFHPDAQGVYP